MRVFFAILIFFSLAEPAHTETFRFPSLGISFEGPDGWIIMSGEQFRSSPDNADFGSDLLNVIISRESNTPFLSLLKYPTPFPGVNPGIHLNKYPGKIINLLAAVGNVKRSLEEYTTDFTLIGGPKLGMTGLFESASITYSYSVVTGGAVLHLVLENFTLVPMGNFYLIISTGTGTEADNKTQAEIRAATNSLFLIE